MELYQVQDRHISVYQDLHRSRILAISHMFGLCHLTLKLTQGH